MSNAAPLVGGTDRADEFDEHGDGFGFARRRSGLPQQDLAVPIHQGRAHLGSPDVRGEDQITSRSHPLDLAALLRSAVRAIAGLGQQLAQQCQLLCIDVLVARVECLGFAADRDEEVALVRLLDLAHRLQQRGDGMPLKVVAQRVSEDVRQGVPLVAIQPLLCRFQSSLSSSSPSPNGLIIAPCLGPCLAQGQTDLPGPQSCPTTPSTQMR
jgi:hypothetical protein